MDAYRGSSAPPVRPPSLGLQPIAWAGIALAALVAGANATMVWLSSRSAHDLVRDDYYEEGLKRDAWIALHARADSLGLDLDLAGAAAGWRATLRPSAAGTPSAPSLERFRGAAASLRFYRPSGRSSDRALDLAPAAPDAHPAWASGPLALAPGLWEVDLRLRSRDGLELERRFDRYVGPDGLARPWAPKPAPERH